MSNYLTIIIAITSTTGAIIITTMIEIVTIAATIMTATICGWLIDVLIMLTVKWAHFVYSVLKCNKLFWAAFYNSLAFYSLSQTSAQAWGHKWRTNREDD